MSKCDCKKNSSAKAHAELSEASLETSERAAQATVGTQNCNCGPDCECGCQEGKECTCEADGCKCGCEDSVDQSADGGCKCGCGCSSECKCGCQEGAECTCGKSSDKRQGSCGCGGKSAGRHEGCNCGGHGKKHGVRTENTPDDIADDFSNGRPQLGLRGK